MNLIETNRNIAFLHFPKCGGTFVAKYLRKQILQGKYTCNDPQSNVPWHDYSFEELIDINSKERQFVWTHLVSPCTYMIETFGHDSTVAKKTFDFFKENGWFTFGFVRDPRDALCSMYFYGQDNINNPDFKWAKQETLEEFIINWHYKPFKIPDYWQEFDFISEFSEFAFSHFLRKYFGHKLSAKMSQSTFKNSSSNKGYDYYCSAGQISDRTQAILDESENMMKFRAIQEQSPAIMAL